MTRPRSHRSTSAILAEILDQHGKHSTLGRKLRANRDRNWLLALTLNSFAKVATSVPLTDLESVIVAAYEAEGLGELMREHGRTYAAMPAQARRDLFPGRFALLDVATGYTTADLVRDLPGLDAAVRSMPNATDVDVAGVHEGRVALADVRRPRRAVVREHGGELLCAVQPAGPGIQADAATDPFSIKATGFHCSDETGVDFFGSDEPYWVFGSVGAGVAITTRSRVFGDVDSGDNLTFNDGEGWIWGQDGQPHPLPDGQIGSLVSLWEHDSGDPEEVRSATAAAFATAAAVLAVTGVAAWVGAVVAGVGSVVSWLIGFMDDDHIADQTFIFDRQTVIDQAGKVGSSFNVSRRFTDGDGDYTLTIAVTHLGPPAPPPATTTVPDVLEEDTGSALADVQAAGLVATTTGTNGSGSWVFRQSPLGGVTVPVGSSVTLLLRTGPRL